MRLLTLDFETVFGDDYTLKKLSTEEYVRDPRFKAHMIGALYPDQAPAVYEPRMLEINPGFRRDIETSAVCCHHAHFDGLILEHHYGLRPALWIDTLSMARLLLPRLRSHSLDALAAHFGLPSKTVPYNLFRGLSDLPPAVFHQLAEGCKHDIWLTFEIAKRLLPLMPRDELKVIDATVRMFTQPVLRLDRPRMAAFLKAEKIRKAKAMLRAGEAIGMPCPLLVSGAEEAVRAHLAVIETELQSSAKFQIALEALGYPCPMKWSEKASAICDDCRGFGQSSVVEAISHIATLDVCATCSGIGKTKGGYIPALAKSDDGMKALLEHEDGRVQALAAARLGVKSTIDETRAERLLAADTRGALPVYLSYAAAKTLRFGGGDKTNWQNFRRGGEIRKSILAPEGHKLVVGDLSQIEYRLLLWVTGQLDKLSALASGVDLYCEFASKFYHETITKEDKPRRGVGKQGILMGGYGAGPGTMIATAAGGGYGPPVFLSDVEGQRMVDLYRSDHPMVQQFWKWCGKILQVLADGGETAYFQNRGLHTLATDPAMAGFVDKESWGKPLLVVRDHRIWLPNGTCLNYEGLRWASNTEIFPGQQDDGQGYAWWQPTRKGYSRIWGSKLTADIIQALARVVIVQALVIVAPRYRVVLQVHDELCCLAPEAEADEALQWVLQVLRTPPAWCADIPLEAEGIASRSYDK